MKLQSDKRTVGKMAARLAGVLTAGVLAVVGLAGAVQAAVPAQATEIHLCARATTLALPGGTVPAWGYAPGDCTDNAPGQVPGPVVAVPAGAPVTVVLHNALGEATGLNFPGQQLTPDRVGAAPGGTATYSFTPMTPGTYLYEAGLVPNTEHQLGMGLYGALVVRPAAANQATDDPASAYDDEAVVVLSEVDPALNTNLNPAGFDLRGFSPKYWLINGQAYPQTATIATDAGRRVLLRYVNAGSRYHSMTVLGLNQTVVGLNGNPAAHPTTVTAHTIAPGQAVDVILAVPPTAPAGGKYPVYDTALMLNNNGAPGFGGMLTFLAVGGIAPGTGDTVGPATGGIGVTLKPDGSVDLAATVSDVATGNSAIAAAEYVFDAAAGPGTAMAASDGTYDTPSEAVAVNVPAAVIDALGSGNHTVYVRGQDAAGNWGAYNLAVLAIDNAGPVVSGLGLAPNPSGGTVAVALSGTASDAATGNNAIAAAEYVIDSGSPVAMTVNAAQVTAGINASLPAATLGALSEGTHVVAVHAKDAAGNWGAAATVNLGIDRTGPNVQNMSAAPNPNNGYQAVNSSQQSVRVNVTLTEVGAGPVASNVARGEAFIDTAGATGTGMQLTPGDGQYNSPTEAAYVFLPLTTIRTLSEGTHQVLVRGQDANGTWGPVSSTPLVVDKTVPTVSGGAISPNPTAGAGAVTLTATGVDAGAMPTAIAAAEWFSGTDPGPGKATPMVAADGSFNATTEGVQATINVGSFARGAYTFSLRVKDAAGNWSGVIAVPFTVTPPDAVFADGFESGNVSAWSGSAGSPAVTAAAALAGSTRGLATTLNTTARHVQDNTPTAEPSYDARFYFHPNGALPGSATPTIFTALNASNTAVFQVQFRRITGPVRYQVRIVASRAGGTTTGNWYTVSNAAHAIEVVWLSGSSGQMALYVDGVLQQALSGLNTSATTYRVDTVRMGPSTGLSGGMSGTLYFDSFASKRSTNTVIGP